MPRGLRIRPAVAVVAALAIGGIAVPGWAGQGDEGTPPAAGDFVFEVTPRAVYHDIPETTVSFDLTAGEHRALTAAGLRARARSPLAKGDNIGNTFGLRCDGPSRQAGPLGSYWATNLVPPGQTEVVPKLRWLLEAKASGTYRCKLRVASYSSIIGGDRKVTMSVAAGARIEAKAVEHAHGWVLPADDRTTVAAGASAVVMRTAVPVPAGSGVRLTQDAGLSTCKPKSSIPGCSGGTAEHSGSTVDTWITAKPRTADGEPCGAALTAPTHTISTARHHLTVTESARLFAGSVAGCADIEVALNVRHVKGNPVLVHAGTSGGHAASHGSAAAV